MRSLRLNIPLAIRCRKDAREAADSVGWSRLKPEIFPEISENFQIAQQQGIATQQSLFFGPNPEISGKVKSENINQKKTESSVSLGRTRRALQPGRRLRRETINHQPSTIINQPSTHVTGPAHGSFRVLPCQE